MFIVFFRAIILYAVIVISIRMMGKRQLGELQPSELVVTVLLSNIATLPVENVNVPMIMGIVPIFTLVSLDVILSHLSLKFRPLRKAICGSAKIIISGGEIDQKVMKDLRFSVDDLMQSLRSQQVFDVSQVQLAVVETTGKISIYQKQKFQNVTCKDMKIKGEDADPPKLIIDSGRLLKESLRSLGFDRAWLDGVLKKQGRRVRDIFLMTCDEDGNTTVVPFEQANGGESA
ncbi:MAG: DUF421 domain-containing protein [Ruminococcus sp.]|nr:DUF421 domain-containing protein [Ruminococcus sp.]